MKASRGIVASVMNIISLKSSICAMKARVAGDDRVQLGQRFEISRRCVGRHCRIERRHMAGQDLVVHLGVLRKQRRDLRHANRRTPIADEAEEAGCIRPPVGRR